MYEFKFGRQLCTTEKPKHMARSASCVAQRIFRQARSGKPGYHWMLGLSRFTLVTPVQLALPSSAGLAIEIEYNFAYSIVGVFGGRLHLVWSLLLDCIAMSDPTAFETPDFGITGTFKPSSMIRNDHIYFYTGCQRVQFIM